MAMGGMMDPSAVSFAGGPTSTDEDAGLLSDIIRPMLLKNRIKNQQGISLGCVLDHLCLTNDRKNSLGGVPKGCTIALAGPPGKGKTRSSLAGLSKVALTGMPVGGEALMHTADVVYLVEEMSLGSKEIAEFWGGKYTEKIEVVSAIKS